MKGPYLVAVELLYSAPLVEARRQQTIELLEGVYPGDTAVILGASTLTPGQNAGHDSYLRQLKRYVESIRDDRLLYEEARGGVLDVATALKKYVRTPGASIFMTPTDGMPILLEALGEDVARDGDSMTESGRTLHLPATPLAELQLLNYGLRRYYSKGDILDTDPQRTAFVGNGAVNGPLIEYLREQNYDPLVVTRDNSTELIPQLHKLADRVITAVGIPGLLTPRDLLRQSGDDDSEPMIIIDAGVASNKSTGMIQGDVDPLMRLYTGEQRLLISSSPVLYPDGVPFSAGGGVGPLTVANFVYLGLRSSLELLSIASPLPVL